MVKVTCPVAVTEEGLKLQLDNEGSPLQANVIAPRPAPLAVTFRTLVAEPPAVTLALVVWAVSASTASISVGSLAVSFAVFDSPPPETVAVLVTFPAAPLATFTVTVIGSKLVPANSVSPRVHCKEERVQFQLAPLMSVAVMPADRVSFTVIRAVVSAGPELETVMV